MVIQKITNGIWSQWIFLDNGVREKIEKNKDKTDSTVAAATVASNRNAASSVSSQGSHKGGFQQMMTGKLIVTRLVLNSSISELQNFIYDDSYVGQSSPACCQAPAAIRGSGCTIYESSYIEFWNSEIELMWVNEIYPLFFFEKKMGQFR